MRYSKTVFAAVFAALLAAPAALPANANWLTALTKGTGKAARHAEGELGTVGRAASHLGDLPAGTKGLAAHVTPEGHWQFVNREGQTFTAGTADEFKRAIPALAPDLAGEGKFALYLSEDSAFSGRAFLDQLPKNAELHVVTPAGAFPARLGQAAELTLNLKPNVAIRLSDRRLFDEVVHYLARPLNKSNIRTIAIEPGESSLVSSAPKLDAATKAPLVDKLDPVHLDRSLSAIRGQTALMVGRIDGGKVYFQPSKGPEIVRDLEELYAAAKSSDVNLVLLNADTPRQPGGQNWLWQKIEVGGLDEAMSKATFGDFLDSLGARRGALSVSAVEDGVGRIRLSAVPDDAGGPAAAAQSAFEEFFGHVTGEVASKGVEVAARDHAEESERDARLIPGIPSHIQIPYFIGIGAGIFGWATSRGWWRRLWAPRLRREDEGRIAHWLKSLPNLVAYLLLFLPVAGVPALLWQGALQLWASVTAPFRWLAKLFRRKAEV